MMARESQLTVPPGFRFHPTDEELLYYYLRKKVSYEAIELDVIREVDLNKLEPWDLKDKCRIGAGPQNEWYFFSHKDKKYPTGTRTNRATMAGFWKATGRDKAIHLTDATRIGMRKTLVFYTGRAPHGQKTDWIMHEYRLDDDYSDVQEDGWVVCRVFKKKIQTRGMTSEVAHNEMELEPFAHTNQLGFHEMVQPQQLHLSNFTGVDAMHLPQLFSPETAAHGLHQTASFFSSLPGNGSCPEGECSQNLLMRFPKSCGGGGGVESGQQQGQERLGSDWSFLDKLLASHNQYNPQSQNKMNNLFISPLNAPDYLGSSAQKFPFSSLCGNDFLKFSK